MTTGIGGAVGVRRTETCLVVWSGHTTTPGTSNRETEAQPIASSQLLTSIFDADALYDAGNQGCGEGPLNQIASLMRKLDPGQTLEIHATDPSVAVDLSAWCRMTGHILADQQGDRYLLRRK